MLSEHHACMAQNNPMVPRVSKSILEGCDLALWRGERLLFEGLGFTVDAGGALLLRGPNGSGKSSLLRVMAGLIAPAAGTLIRDGASILNDPEVHHDSLHYVGHLDAVKPVLTVAENLSFWAALRGDTTQVDDALETFGLAPLAGISARLLSSGQRRRLNLARISANPAPLWLLDEPAVGLDIASVAILTSLIAAHQAQGGIVILSTHTDLRIEKATILQVNDFASAVVSI